MPHEKLNQLNLEIGDLTSYFRKIEDRANLLHDSQITFIGGGTDKLPSAGLYAIQLVAAGTRELLQGCLNNHANAFISDDAPPWLVDGIYQERVRLLYLMLGAMFVQCISGIEYCMTHSLPAVEDVHPPPRKRAKIYIVAVMLRSAKLGWVSHAEAAAWSGINEFRNALVHRNGISDKDATYPITDRWALQFAKGRSITAKLDLYPDLIMWALENYGKWAQAYLNHVRPKGWGSLISV